MSVDARLRELGIELPSPPAARRGTRFPFAPVRVDSSIAYVSGHGPVNGDTVLVTGRLGADVDVAAGTRTAELCALSMLASLRAVLGTLDQVTGWLRVLGFVRCAPAFTDLPSVLNGFSDLIITLWGDPGVHARSAIGVAELPFAIPVEVEATVAIEGRG
jgi:enamine deaminase RidA (YjgF/YER057c/UK114 family)